MKQLVRGFGENLKKVFTSFTFEHSGEMMSLRDKKLSLASHIDLEESPVIKLKHQTFESSLKRIAVVFDKQTPLTTLHYAANTANRYNAELDVITKIPGLIVKDKLKNLGIVQTKNLNIIDYYRDPLEGVSDYMKRYPSALFIITSDQDAVVENYVTTRTADKTMCAPWLVVSDAQPVAA